LAKKKKVRPAEPTVIGDLLPGDRCIIDSDWGPIPVRIGWHHRNATFVTVESPGAKPESKESSTPILELGKLMPNPRKGSRKKQADIDDPLLGKI
jgi:hypothetical protein